MTAYDALTCIMQVAQAHQACAKTYPCGALSAINAIAQQCQPQPWTTALPTQPGWYGHKNRHGHGSCLALECGSHGEGILAHLGDGRVLPVEHVGGQWKGPLDLEAL